MGGRERKWEERREGRREGEMKNSTVTVQCSMIQYRVKQHNTA